jgi:5-methylcytosine-specific restriction enzyme subunit McrC
MRIDLTDNNTERATAAIFHRKDISALFPVANKKISQLCKENKNLLVFPDSIEASEDVIGDASIMTILNTDNPETVRVTTDNVMGFIGVGNLQVKIKSRFDNGRDDYFLHYMLQKVFSFNLFDLNHNNEKEDVFDFVMFMFPYFLKKAMRQGIYREYKNFKRNDANIKGPVDLGRHIARNIPFVCNVAYSTREFSHDNSMTELIRHTIEFMKTKKYGQAVLNIDRETKGNVKAIVEYTPSYNKNERKTIISKNLRHKEHPYYTEYIGLQSICLQILRMEEIKYGETDDEICGILFDGAWLWEEYVNTILKKEGFSHPQNRKSKGGIYLFVDNSGIRYPDFYNSEIVLDAKYKRLASYEKMSQVGRDDLHQIITYVANLRVPKGGFVAPLPERQIRIPKAQVKSPASTLFIFGIEICRTATSYADFCEKMKEKEEEFLESLNQKLYEN